MGPHVAPRTFEASDAVAAPLLPLEATSSLASTGPGSSSARGSLGTLALGVSAGAPGESRHLEDNNPTDNNSDNETGKYYGPWLYPSGLPWQYFEMKAMLEIMHARSLSFTVADHSSPSSSRAGALFLDMNSYEIRFDLDYASRVLLVPDANPPRKGYTRKISKVKWFREIVSAFQRQTILGDIILVAKAEDDVAMLTFHFEFFNFHYAVEVVTDVLAFQ